MAGVVNHVMPKTRPFVDSQYSETPPTTPPTVPPTMAQAGPARPLTFASTAFNATGYALGRRRQRHQHGCGQKPLNSLPDHLQLLFDETRYKSAARLFVLPRVAARPHDQADGIAADGALRLVHPDEER
jgi:hypothetical protein